MDQTTAFSPPLVCKLLDDSTISFARVTMDMWATLAAEMNADRIKTALETVDNDATLKPKEKAELRMFAYDSIVPLYQVMNLCVTHPKWIVTLLTTCAKACGHTADEIPAKLALIPPQDQNSIANQVAMLAVVKNSKRGTGSDPYKPGVDFSTVTTNGDQPADSSDATDSTPADSHGEPSLTTAK